MRAKTIKKSGVDRHKLKGLTKKQHKKQFASSTPGTIKVETCRATPEEKGLAKYPRSHKTSPNSYVQWILKKDKFAKRENTFFTN